MKKISTRLIILISVIALFTFSGCKKIWDYVKDHPGGIADNCRVEQLTYKFQFEWGKTFYDTSSIAYNASGNPVSMKYAVSRNPEMYEALRGWAVPDRLLKYDDKNRLVVYIDCLANEFENGEWEEFPFPNPYPLESGYVVALTWHKYTYVNSTLVTDSIWNRAGGKYLTQNIPDGGYLPRYIEEYTLDTYGRIIKVDSKCYISDSGIWVICGTEHFTYDASGNLVKQGVTYGNKKNILQTNKVWMFLARDYSVNAPQGQALSYNSNNLPVVFNKVAPPFLPAVIAWDGFGEDANARAYYKCK